MLNDFKYLKPYGCAADPRDDPRFRVDSIVAPFWERFGSLWAPLGTLLAPSGRLWLALPPICSPGAPLWLPSGFLWFPCGSLSLPFGSLWGPSLSVLNINPKSKMRIPKNSKNRSKNNTSTWVCDFNINLALKL